MSSSVIALPSAGVVLARTSPFSIIIDASATPCIPPELNSRLLSIKHRDMGIVMLEKRPDGQLYLNDVRVARRLSSGQKTVDGVRAYKIVHELRACPTPNAMISQALYNHRQLIPDDWQNTSTYFLGTKLRDLNNGRVYVERHSYSPRGQLKRRYCWIGALWFGNEYVAYLENN